MTKARKILKVLTSKPTIEGAGVHLKRAFGFSQVPMFDPFLMLDDFDRTILRTMSKVFLGTHIVASRPSHTCSREP